MITAYSPWRPAAAHGENPTQWWAVEARDAMTAYVGHPPTIHDLEFQVRAGVEYVRVAARWAPEARVEPDLAALARDHHETPAHYCAAGVEYWKCNVRRLLDAHQAATRRRGRLRAR